MDTRQANATVTEYFGHIRGIVANCLRTSRHYGEWNVDDMTQEVVEYLLRKTLPAYDASKGGALKGWITCQTVNLCNNFHKRAVHRYGHDTIDCTDATAEDETPAVILRDEGPTPFASLLRAQERVALHAAIERVCTASEQQLLADYLGGCSLSQAAKHQGRSPAWATIAMRRIERKVTADLR